MTLLFQAAVLLLCCQGSKLILELYLIHFPRRRINNLDMTKWKQTPNGITAVIVPRAVLELLHSVVQGLTICFSDHPCAAPSVSICEAGAAFSVRGPAVQLSRQGGGSLYRPIPLYLRQRSCVWRIPLRQHRCLLPLQSNKQSSTRFYVGLIYSCHVSIINKNHRLYHKDGHHGSSPKARPKQVECPLVVGCS